MDYDAEAEPLIDLHYFPYTQPSNHWTSQTGAGERCPLYDQDFNKIGEIDGGNAWEVHFDKGHAETHWKFDDRLTGAVQIYVRLVRGPG